MAYDCTADLGDVGSIESACFRYILWLEIYNIPVYHLYKDYFPNQIYNMRKHLVIIYFVVACVQALPGVRRKIWGGRAFAQPIQLCFSASRTGRYILFG